jgi:thiosulfate/3-mercaptopyruvate sulfurtransferase
LISAEELSKTLADAGAKQPLILDLRPPDAYAAGHLPGALHLDLFGVSLIDTDPAPLKAFLWMIEHMFATRGVEPSTPVVVYDDQSGIRAARAFWFLEHFGHPSVRVLDGGFGAWTRAALPVTREAAIGQSDSVIVDARTDGEYCGTTVRAARGGAVPGAVHIEWTRNLDPDGAFKPASELKKMYEDVGVTPDREVITYCQGGYRAAHSYLALRLIGYPRVRNYLGSWKEWGDRMDLPIEVPQGG